MADLGHPDFTCVGSNRLSSMCNIRPGRDSSPWFLRVFGRTPSYSSPGMGRLRVMATLMVAAVLQVGCGDSSSPPDDGANPRPPSVNVSGEWETTWGSANADMTLSQSGADVVGSYATQIGSIDPYYEYGSLSGRLSDRTLAGSASDSYGTVSLEFEFSADAQSFLGTYGESGTWNGEKDGE